MTNLTQQIVLKISPELDGLLDKAFDKSRQETGNPPTRSDYIRSVLERHCLSELKPYKSVANFYVKDELLNKVIWTLLCKIHQGSLPQQNPFRALHLNDFIVGARTEIEEIFLYLKDRGVVDLDKDHNGFLTLRLRIPQVQDIIPAVYESNIQELKNIAKENIINSDEMQRFIELLKLWNTNKSKYSINDICFMCFHLPQAKDNLSNNGFIITGGSICVVADFMKGVIVDSPSEYARQLWGLPLFKNSISPSDLYITYPDIYIGK
jgi:hypothetical protein